MPHSNGKIYTDHTVTPKKGIDVRNDIAYTLGRNTGNVGQLCGDVDENGNRAYKINENSLFKPVRSSLRRGTEQEIRVPAAYGWSIMKKAAYSNTDNFINTLRTNGANYKYWEYQPPRGAKGAYMERYRVNDFDKYNHYQLPYRTPCFLNRLQEAELNISGSYEDVTIPRQQTVTQGFDSNSFSLRDAYDVTVVVSIIDPDPETGASFMNWNIDGSFDITLVDSAGHVVDHDYQTGFGIKDGNIPQAVSMHFEGYHSLEGYTGPFHIEYRFHFSNESNYSDGTNTVYVPVTIRVETVYAASLTMSRTGQDGVVIRPAASGADWNSSAYAKSAVFGEDGGWALAVIEVYNGSTTQRKIALIPSSGFIPFKRIGITIQPRRETNAKDVIVYLLYGDYRSIFPDFQNQVDYGNLSLANAHVLTCAPNCYNELGIIPEEPLPMIVYQDDFQGGTFTYRDGTEESGIYPHGAAGSRYEGFTNCEKSLASLVLRWGFFIENMETSLPVYVHLDLYNGDDELVGGATSYYEAIPNSSKYWGVTAELQVQSGIFGYAPYELYAKLWIDVNGDIYYVNIGYSTLVLADPGYYRLGWQDS